MFGGIEVETIRRGNYRVAWVMAVFAFTIPFSETLVLANMSIPIILAAVTLLDRRHRKTLAASFRRSMGFTIPLAFFAAFILANGFRAEGSAFSSGQLGFWYAGICVSLASFSLQWDRKAIGIVFAGLLTGAVAGSLFGFYQLLFENRRLFTGPLLNPNLFGGYLVAILPLGIAWMIREHRKFPKVLLIMAVLIVGAAIAMTRCRGSEFSVFIGVIFLSWALRVYWLAPALGLYLFLWDRAIPAIMGGLVPALQSHRNVGNADETIALRLRLWLAGWKVFLSSPLTGGGTGSFPVLAARQGITGIPLETSGVAINCHNTLIQLLAEQGIIGFALFIGSMVSAAVTGIHSYLTKRDPWLAGLIASFIAFAGQNLTNSLLTRTYGSMAGWMVLTLMLVGTNTDDGKE